MAYYWKEVYNCTDSVTVKQRVLCVLTHGLSILTQPLLVLTEYFVGYIRAQLFTSKKRTIGPRAQLSGAQLSGAQLSGARFTGAQSP